MSLLGDDTETVELTVKVERDMWESISYDSRHDRFSDIGRAKRTLSAGIGSVDVEVEDDDLTAEPDDPRTVTADQYLEFVLSELGDSGR